MPKGEHSAEGTNNLPSRTTNAAVESSMYHAAAADEALGWGRGGEEPEGPDYTAFQEGGYNGMDDLDLDYLSTPNVDIWPKDPAQNITQSRPTSYTDVINSTDAEKLASSSDHPTPQSMETEDKQKASGRQESRHLSLKAARSLAESKPSPAQLLEVLATLGSDQDGESGERHAPPLRRTFKQGRDTAGEAGRHSAGYLEAGQSSSLQHAMAQATAHCPTSAESSESVQQVPDSSNDHAWAEDSTAQYSALEEQLRDAHLGEDINWDKLTATVMQQMAYQRM